MKYKISRERHLFGSHVEFSDRDEAEAKDVVIECLSYDDDSYHIKMKERDKGIQVCFNKIFHSESQECLPIKLDLLFPTFHSVFPLSFRFIWKQLRP